MPGIKSAGSIYVYALHLKSNLIIEYWQISSQLYSNYGFESGSCPKGAGRFLFVRIFVIRDGGVGQSPAPTADGTGYVVKIQ